MTIDLGSWSGEAFSKGILWFACGFFAIAFLVRLKRVNSDSAVQKRLDEVWTIMGYPKTDAAGSEAIQMRLLVLLTRQEQAAWIGALIGVMLTAIGLLVLPATGTSLYMLLVAYPLCAICAGLGQLIELLRTNVFRPDAQQRRVARLSHPVLSDYMSRRLIYLPIALLILTIAADLLSVFMAKSSQATVSILDSPVPLIVQGLALIAGIACFLALRTVLSQPRSAEAAAQLSWDDSMRARTLLKIVEFAAIALSFAFVLTVFLLFFGVRDLADPQADIYLMASVAAACLPFYLYASKSAKNFFRSKLWPSTLSHSELRPGAA